MRNLKSLLPLVAFFISLLLHVMVLFFIFSPVKSSSPVFEVAYSKAQVNRASLPFRASVPRRPKEKSDANLVSSVVANAASESADLNESKDSLSISGTSLGLQLSYPRLSRLLGEEGQVAIELRRVSDGNWSPPRVLISSGFSRLDQAALEAIQQGLAKIKSVGLPENVTSLKVTFTFRLVDQSPK